MGKLPDSSRSYRTCEATATASSHGHLLHLLEPAALGRAQVAGHVDQPSQHAFQPFPLFAGRLFSLRRLRPDARASSGSDAAAGVAGARDARRRPTGTRGAEGSASATRHGGPDQERDDGFVNHGVDLDGV